MPCLKSLRIAALALVMGVGACAAPAKKHTPAKPASRPAATQTQTRTQTAAPRQTAPGSTQKSPATAPATTPAPAQQARMAAPAPVPAATPQGRYAQALELLKASQWQEAEAALMNSVREFPKQSGPYTNLGILFARTNRKPQALSAFRRAVAANPRNAVAHNWLGLLAREAGDYANAEAAYRRAVNADSAYAPAWLNLAILFDQYLKKPRDALTAYRRYRDLSGGQDPRAAVWIAELETRLKPQGAQP